MAKYINPGYGQLINAGTDGILTQESFTYNPSHGVALSLPDETSDVEEYILPSIPVIFNGRDIYLKFDMYLPEEVPYPAANVLILGEYMLYISIKDYSGNFGINDNFGDIYVYADSTKLISNTVNTIWIGYVSATHKIQLIVNGETVANMSLSMEIDTSKVSFNAQSFAPISNIIISDEYVDPREVIVELNASAVDTTMAVDGAQYKAVEGNAYVLHTPDISNARGLFGNSGRILGLAAIAAPAYTTGDDVTSIKCRTVDGETVTDYSAQNLSSDTSAMLAEYLPVSSDMTVASLADFKIGWVTL